MTAFPISGCYSGWSILFWAGAGRRVVASHPLAYGAPGSYTRYHSLRWGSWRSAGATCPRHFAKCLPSFSWLSQGSSYKPTHVRKWLLAEAASTLPIHVYLCRYSQPQLKVTLKKKTTPALKTCNFFSRNYSFNNIF